MALPIVGGLAIGGLSWYMGALRDMSSWGWGGN